MKGVNEVIKDKNDGKEDESAERSSEKYDSFRRHFVVFVINVGGEIVETITAGGREERTKHIDGRAERESSAKAKKIGRKDV